jgi:hypothetical protein
MNNPGCLLPFLPIAILAGLLSVLLLIPVQIETTPDMIATVGPLFKASQSDISLTTQLDQAEALWNAQAINSYTITVYNSRPLSSLEPTITVIDGEIVESSAVCWQHAMSEADCVPPPFDPAVYTVPGLFDMIRNVFKYANPTAVKRLEFDPTYGYLTHISYNDPQIEGEDWWIEVEKFEIIHRGEPTTRP